MDKGAIQAAFENYKMDMFRFSERDAMIIYPSGKANGRMILKTERFRGISSCRRCL